MSRWKTVTILVVVGLISAVWIGRAFSQEGGGRPGAPAGARAGRRRFDPEQMRQAYFARIKETLELTDTEWKVLQPKIEKVQTLSGQLRRIRWMGLGMGSRGRVQRRRGGPEAPGTPREQTEAEKKTEELRILLENKDATPKDIKAKLTALREAREKIKQELAKAQEELCELLTIRREALLVLMGLLN